MTLGRVSVVVLLMWAFAAAGEGTSPAAPTGPRPAEPEAASLPAAEQTAAHPGAAVLTVVVTGGAEAKGQLIVRAFTSADGWPKPKHAAASAVVPARAPQTEVRLDGLPPGPCAVSVVHDLDGNGKLTMAWFPYPHPAEPTGASSGATGRFGPPSFDAARFELPPGGTTTRIELHP